MKTLLRSGGNMSMMHGAVLYAHAMDTLSHTSKHGLNAPDHEE